jgi:dTDP-4-amino-4,6-dideoxygalactose transaminase
MTGVHAKVVSEVTAVPFNLPPVTGKEMAYLEDALRRRELEAYNYYTRRCQGWLQEQLGVREALLTHSCTSALEMAAILAELGPGDEVLMPSYTFTSTANAVVLRGAVPVFVDIRSDTLNIDPDKIETAITPRTKAIIVVHYAGVCADMDEICAIARAHGLWVVEDAAQALLSTYRGRPAGTLGDLGCFSFHASKNIVAGEGGALTINHSAFAERAYIIAEKGTNRRQFFAGLVDKYSWVDVGSSYGPSELTAAFLLAQLEAAQGIIAARLAVWHRYHESFAELEAREALRRPVVPAECGHNGHIYYLIMPSNELRDAMIAQLAYVGVKAPFHYVPLHSAPAGKRYGRTSGSLPVTEDLSARLLRLPLFWDIDGLADEVIDRVYSAWAAIAPAGQAKLSENCQNRSAFAPNEPS